MAWSKGAVVIKKHGDEEWANEMEKVLNIQKAADKEKEELERDNTFMKKHIVEGLEQKIFDAELNYGYNWVPPKWAKGIVEAFAFIVYHFSVFVDGVLHGKEHRK